MVYSRDTTSCDDGEVRKDYGSAYGGHKDYRNDKIMIKIIEGER
jgi:hypothetical protein